MKKAPTPVTPERAIVRLADLCMRAEHSVGELRDKLRRWGIVGTDADKIIDQLVEQRFVDDRRFADSYVNDKVRFARWGRRKIQQGLYAKRINSATAREALDTIDQEVYAENIRHLLTIKTKSDPTLLSTYEGRTRLYRFLITRGYESTLAASVLRSFLKA